MLRLTELFMNNRHLVSITILVVFVGGFLLLSSNPREGFPNIDTNKVSIVSLYPGASPEDVEINVTLPIEEKLREVQGIEEITSISIENYSQIMIQIDQNLSGSRKQDVVDDIKRAVDRISDFPAEMTDRPEIREIKISDLPVVEVALSAADPVRLRDIAWNLERKIERLPGVSAVEKVGYFKKEVHVEIDPWRLSAQYLSLPEVIQAIRNRDVRASAGTLESRQGLQNVVILNKFRNPLEVGRVILRSNFEEKQVFLAQVAGIRETVKNERLQIRNNGNPGLSLVIKKKHDADIIDTIAGVRRLMERETPAGVTWTLINDQSSMTRSRINLLLGNGLSGLLIVIALLLLFLNRQVAFWTAFGIPFSFFATFLFLPLFGITINAVSLGGLIVVLGMVVDDAIVVGERVSRYREEGLPAGEAARRGVREMAGPVTAAALTTICSYSTIFFLGGLQGKFAVAIPIVVILTLLLSLAECLFILPAHLAHSRIRPRQKARWLLRLEEGYRRLLVRALRFRYPLVIFFLLFLVFTARFTMSRLRFELFPQSAVDTFYIKVEGPRDQDLRQTLRQVMAVEKVAQRLPRTELDSLSARVGHMDLSPEKNTGDSENRGIIAVFLQPDTIRKRSADQIIDALRPQLPRMPGVKVTFEKKKFGPVAGRPVQAVITGGSWQDRVAAEQRVLAFLQGLEKHGLLDRESDRKRGKDELVVVLDHTRMAAYGVNVSDVAHCLRIAFDGHIASSIRTEREEIDYRVILSPAGRQRFDVIGEIGIPNNQGRLIPLKHCISYRKQSADQEIRHHDGERSITVTADVDAGRLTALAVASLLRDELKARPLPGGVTVRMVGEVVESNRTMHNTLTAIFFAVFLIFAILAVMLKSWGQPLIIMSVIPFGAIGILWAVFLHGLNLSLFVLLGLVSLSGIVVNDSIVMVDTLNSVLRNGTSRTKKELSEEVAAQAMTRLRPILLTTLTTVAGLFPMAYGLGGYDFVLSPMALAVGWGLLFATLITLFLIPSLYLFLKDLEGLRKRVFSRQPGDAVQRGSNRSPTAAGNP